jgi:hypothetical protein
MPFQGKTLENLAAKLQTETRKRQKKKKKKKKKKK